MEIGIVVLRDWGGWAGEGPGGEGRASGGPGGEGWASGVAATKKGRTARTRECEKYISDRKRSSRLKKEQRRTTGPWRH